MVLFCLIWSFNTYDCYMFNTINIVQLTSTGFRRRMQIFFKLVANINLCNSFVKTFGQNNAMILTARVVGFLKT